MHCYKFFKFFGNSAPPFKSEIFSPVGQGRITRRSENKLKLPFRKTNPGQNGLSYIGTKIWNSLQSGLKDSNNVNSFKHKIKDEFFNDLQNRENSPYISIIKFLKASQKLSINISQMQHYCQLFSNKHCFPALL